MTEKPDTVHGRLLEAVHISGYSFERACSELEWLLEEDRWQVLGFKDGAAFGESIYDLFSGFNTTIEQRRPLAEKLTSIMSQRAAGKVLGISHTQVQRDLDPGTNVPTTDKNNKENQEHKQDNGTNVPPEWFQDDIDPAEATKGQSEKKRRAQEKVEARERHNAGLATNVGLPDGKYAAIYADPPWSFRVWSGTGKDRAAENHYPTMSQEEIEALPILEMAADDCALFLWAVMPQLPEALAVINAWGFEFKTCAFVWAKTTKDEERYATGMGYWTRANAELCLLATRGSPQRINADVHQIIEAPRGKHSAKPAEAAERIERLVSGPYLELFARQCREGWATWGNEI